MRDWADLGVTSADILRRQAFWERRQRARRARLAGATYVSIGKALGVGTKTARDLVLRAEFDAACPPIAEDFMPAHRALSPRKV